MKEALPDDGLLVACELGAYAAAFAERALARSPRHAKSRVERSPALGSLRRLTDTGATFDLIFIDADKPRYGGYADPILDSSPLAPNGLTCVETTLLQGQPYLPGEPSANGRTITGFSRMVAADPRVEQSLLPLRDGVTTIRRARPSPQAQ